MLTTKSIVIKNQFMNKRYPSKGHTPSSFVISYMARDDATMTVYPVSNIWTFDDESVFKKNSLDLIGKKENFDQEVPSDDDWDALTNLEGRSFDNSYLSMSKKDIRKSSRAIQKAYDDGHTIMKLIFSFDNDYLVQQNVEKPGSLDFRNTVDELKLRQASREGIRKMAKLLGYTKPLFVGCVQLDRDHPHVHLVLTETADKRHSHARYRVGNAEFGLVNQKTRKLTCRAIDDKLEELKVLTIMPSNGVYNAQKLLHVYSNVYSTLPQKKDLVMQASLNQDELPVYLNAVSKTIAQKKKAPLDKARKFISSELNHVDHDEPLPRIFSNRNLRKRQKKVKKDLTNELDRERELMTAQINLARMRINLSGDIDFLQDYFAQKLLICALKIDRARSFMYNGIKKPPKELKALMAAIKDFPTDTRIHRELKRLNLLETAVDAHQQGYLSAKGIKKALNGEVPDLLNNPLADRDIRKARFVPNYYTNDEHAEVVLNSLPINTNFMQSLLPDKKAKLKELPEEKPQKTISLNQADKILNKIAETEVDVWI